MMDLRIGLVGPLPPPAGGMANQTRQLRELLVGEGAAVELVQTNAPYRPPFVARLRGLRAAFRLFPYIVRLWDCAGRVDLLHVMANSGWAWHLFAAPAIWVAKLRGVPVVVNYRGGEAEQFLRRSALLVRPTMRMANRLVVPSGFLVAVFGRYAMAAEIVPNVVDLRKFAPRSAAVSGAAPHIVVTRNLESIYGLDIALQAFRLVLGRFPDARLTIAGDGPERSALGQLARDLQIAERVTFTGRLDGDGIAALYGQAHVFLNPSRVDNTPNSILEALAAEVPVVTTDVGGIPYLVTARETALLVASGNAQAMADAIFEMLDDPALAQRLAKAGQSVAQKHAWTAVRPTLFAIYRQVVSGAAATSTLQAK